MSKKEPVVIPEDELSNYISLDQFSELSRIRPTTIKKRADDIPGLIFTTDGYLALKGTRYPHKHRKYKLDSSAKRRYILLRAINANEYISHEELSMDEADFNLMLRQCKDIGLLEKRELPNQFGANGYVCTAAGEDFVLNHAKHYDDNKWIRFENMIPELVEAAVKGVTKAVLDQISKIFTGDAPQ